MLDTHTYRGLWWTPSAPDEKLAGTLTITKGDPRLDVVGDLGREILGETEGERMLSLSLADQERILGVTTEGIEVTLIDCVEASSQTHLPGLPTVIYRARTAILGHIFQPGVPVDLDAIEIRTNELEQWVGHIPFPVQHFDSTNDAMLATVAITRPKSIEIPLTNGDRAQLRFQIRTSGLGVPTTDADLQYAAWIGVGFAQKRELTESIRTADQLRNFLSLAVGKPLTVLAIDGYRSDVIDNSGHRKPLQIFAPDPVHRTLGW